MGSADGRESPSPDHSGEPAILPWAILDVAILGSLSAQSLVTTFSARQSQCRSARVHEVSPRIAVVRGASAVAYLNLARDCIDRPES
jgi:hypothetical protein